MKKSLTIFIVMAVMLGVSIAWAAEPGTQEDPLVSKSYVDAASSFLPIELAAGQTLTGVSGTEMILRSGEATAIDNGSDGISDLTAGVDLMTGSQVVSNHLLLVPRDDGRGITALIDSWVMIKGGYNIK